MEINFKDFEFTGDGWNVGVESKFLNWLFVRVGKKIRKKFIRAGVIKDKDTVIMSTNYSIRLSIKKKDGDNNE